MDGAFAIGHVSTQFATGTTNNRIAWLEAATTTLAGWLVRDIQDCIHPIERADTTSPSSRHSTRSRFNSYRFNYRLSKERSWSILFVNVQSTRNDCHSKTIQFLSPFNGQTTGDAAPITSVSWSTAVFTLIYADKKTFNWPPTDLIWSLNSRNNNYSYIFLFINGLIDAWQTLIAVLLSVRDFYYLRTCSTDLLPS